MTVTINGSGPIGGVTTLGNVTTLTMSSGTIAGLSAGGLPSASVTQSNLAAGVAGNGPAFSATKTQSLSQSVNTKFACDTVQFNQNNCYDASSTFRFTPTIAGYYDIKGRMQVATTNTSIRVIVYKNGSAFIGLASTFPNSSDTVSGSWLVYCNGTTDYIEMYGQQDASVQNCYVGFQGVLVRAA